MGAGQGFKEDVTGQTFHFCNGLFELTPVLDGPAQKPELRRTERDGDRLARLLAGPLETRARAPKRGPVHDRAVADVAEAGEARAQAAVLALR